MDGRSGYVLAVNPSGARYDALINPGGEGENRWASPQRQYQITQTSRAGLLTELPDSNTGRVASMTPNGRSRGGAQNST